MSIVEDVEKLIWEVARRPPLLIILKNEKNTSDRTLKEKLWYEVCELVVTNCSELPAEQKSERCMLIFLLIMLGTMLMMLIYWAEAYTL